MDVHKREKLPVSVAVFTHRKAAVLCNTLLSYKKGGLLDVVEEAAVYCNEATALDEAVCGGIPIRFVSRPDCNSLAVAQNQAATESSSEYILFLEDDFFLLSGEESTRRILEEALSVLSVSQDVEAVRLRHRQRPGHPLYPSWFMGAEDEGDLRKRGHLLDCVHWYPRPEVEVPQVQVSKVPGLADDWYVASHRNACYTNNPCLYRRDWWLTHILPINRGPAADNEKLLGEPWMAMEPFFVAQGPGLFSHWDFVKHMEHTMADVRFLEAKKPIADFMK